MKSIKFIFCTMALAFTTLMSCSDDNEVDLSNRKFVRIDQSSVYLEIDETATVTASVDDLAGDSVEVECPQLRCGYH